MGLTTHGQKGTRLYSIWCNMKSRCYNPKAKHYWDYGGRGIKICHWWRTSFVSFFKWAIRNGYNDQLTIERKNPNGNYSPKNCTWSTVQAQARNKRNTLGEYNVRIIKNSLRDGARICDLARKYNVTTETIRRIKTLVTYPDVVHDPVVAMNMEEDLPF